MNSRDFYVERFMENICLLKEEKTPLFYNNTVNFTPTAFTV